MFPRAINKWLHLAAWLGALVIWIAPHGTAWSEELAGEALVKALRQGGHNIYFRHAETDWSQNDQVEAVGDWISCDPLKIRQLSDSGRATARQIGDAIRTLRIPVGKVLSSQYCRAAETARLFGLGQVEVTRDIMNMRAAEYVGGREAVIRRARRLLSEQPPPGTNVIIVGHGNLMRAATDAYPSEGGSGIFVPRLESERGFELVIQLSSEDWIRLATRFAGN